MGRRKQKGTCMECEHTPGPADFFCSSWLSFSVRAAVILCERSGCRGRASSDQAGSGAYTMFASQSVEAFVTIGDRTKVYAAAGCCCRVCASSGGWSWRGVQGARGELQRPRLLTDDGFGQSNSEGSMAHALIIRAHWTNLCLIGPLGEVLEGFCVHGFGKRSRIWPQWSFQVVCCLCMPVCAPALILLPTASHLGAQHTHSLPFPGRRLIMCSDTHKQHAHVCAHLCTQSHNSHSD